MAAHPREAVVPMASVVAALEDVPVPDEWRELYGLPPGASADLLRRGRRSMAAAKGWALRRGEWEGYLHLHGHADIRYAFLRLPLDQLDGETYWRLMQAVWSMSDNLTERALWRALLSRHPEHRAAMMTRVERAKLASLPERVAVWRGVSNAEHAEGFSWTLSRRRAHWFAKRWALEGTSPLLLSGTVAKADVIAYLAKRGEREIVALPESVEVIGKSRLRTTR